MKIIKESKWSLAFNLKGRPIYVKTIWEKNNMGEVYSRRIAVRQKNKKEIIL